jgi:LysR family transcriptional regulator, regulator for bpeEF and oprC
MTLEQLRVLVRVVQAGSFTKAADLMGSQKSYMSRVVSQLEAELGAKLLERTTRTLHVTELGREVVERALGILSAVDDTARLAQSAKGEPQGVLRLTCGVEFGMLAVGRWVDDYLARYPSVAADVEYASRVIDLVHEGFDLAVRVGPVQESRLVARQLGHLEYGLFACPHYLERCGRPDHLDALSTHSLVMFSGGSHRKGWSLVDASGQTRRIDGPARLRVNNSFGVRDAVLRSIGIGLLPLLVAADGVAQGRLQPLLPDWRPAPVPVSAVYPSNRYLSPKVRAFVDMALERFPVDSAAARHTACVHV